jgi:hypothetical protein
MAEASHIATDALFAIIAFEIHFAGQRHQRPARRHFHFSSVRAYSSALLPKPTDSFAARAGGMAMTRLSKGSDARPSAVAISHFCMQSLVNCQQG